MRKLVLKSRFFKTSADSKKKAAVAASPDATLVADAVDAGVQRRRLTARRLPSAETEASVGTDSTHTWEDFGQCSICLF